jgi:ABC-2 type transport system ATP-binding protein
MNDETTKKAVITVAGLEKTFGRLKAVDGLSFDVFHGEVFGFLGPNGAGKTTSINMICGLSQPGAGEIIYFNDRGKSKKEIKTQIGICPQENIFWPKMTCLEQLVFMAEMYGRAGAPANRRAKELLTWMGLEEKADVLAYKLSGGMKRRLNICLALVHDPEILVLDEPEAGLDPQSRLMVRNFIKNLAKEKTIILTTHNMDEADRLADRVAIIDHGKLLNLDTPANLKKSIGEGDMLEIRLYRDEAEGETALHGTDELVNSLAGMCDQVQLGGATLLIKAKNLVNSIADITGKIKERGFGIGEIKLRENTLEDVFIHLTGRTLRQ